VSYLFAVFDSFRYYHIAIATSQERTLTFLFFYFTVLVESQPVLLGTLRPIFHETSGRLYAIDEKTFFIENFMYDGQGVSK